MKDHTTTARTVRATLGLVLALSAGLSAAQTPEQINKMEQDRQYCYGLAGMANMTVQNRNAGHTLDEQLERRQKTLGASSAEYKLVDEVTRQVYDKDLREPLPVAADTHRTCLAAKGSARFYSDRALRSCPAIGLMVAEISAARRRGATIEQTVTLVGDRYGPIAKSYSGGAEKIAAKHSESSAPDNGSFDYLTCMILGMTGG